MKHILKRLFDSWTGPGPLDVAMFSEDFVYDAGSNLYSTDDWLSANEYREPPVDVVLINIEADNEEWDGLLVFEFFDPVTLLHHRVTWSVATKGGLITKVIEMEPGRRGDRKG